MLDKPENELLAAMAAVQLLENRGITNHTATKILFLVALKEVQEFREVVNLTTMAVELGLTTSGVHRAIKSLTEGETPLVDTRGIMQGARSGGIRLTKYGRYFIAEYLKVLMPMHRGNREDYYFGA